MNSYSFIPYTVLKQLDINVQKELVGYWRYLEGMTQHDIAAGLGISIATSNNYVRKLNLPKNSKMKEGYDYLVEDLSEVSEYEREILLKNSRKLSGNLVSFKGSEELKVKLLENDKGVNNVVEPKETVRGVGDQKSDNVLPSPKIEIYLQGQFPPFVHKRDLTLRGKYIAKAVVINYDARTHREFKRVVRAMGGFDIRYRNVGDFPYAIVYDKEL